MRERTTLTLHHAHRQTRLRLERELHVIGAKLGRHRHAEIWTRANFHHGEVSLGGDERVRGELLPILGLATERRDLRRAARDGLGDVRRVVFPCDVVRSVTNSSWRAFRRSAGFGSLIQRPMSLNRAIDRRFLLATPHHPGWGKFSIVARAIVSQPGRSNSSRGFRLRRRGYSQRMSSR